MSGGENWRTEVNSGDYFLHRQKKLDFADRRPVIRQASDLVGPGISANSVRLDDFNDLLATFNGYYSSAVGALSAPNGVEAFVGHVVSDAEFGGLQVFTGLTSGSEYRRTFERSPVDPEAIAWGLWTGGDRAVPTAQGYGEVDSEVLPGQPTLLFAPNIVTNTGSEVYQRTDAGINILRQGVYTGHIQVGDRVGSTTLTNLSVYVPSIDTTQGLVQLSVPLAQTEHVPFTVWVNNGAQAFAVAATHAEAEHRFLWWRFTCTRIGDAL